MRINAQTHNVVLTGVEATKEFSIKPGAHIMYVLSSLYANPLAALFREYATNMRDAYFASGYVKPINGIIPPEIFLPTSLDPTLIFKDYGVGMSLDTVMRVFTTYGDSTKGASNDETGGFGLGSKSAYCYQSGQHWTVESRFNGEKHSFMMYVNAQNIPEAAHVSTVDTDEPNGVTIMIPILDQHINQVHDIARTVMASYSSIPVIVHNLIGEPIVRVADRAMISRSSPGFTYRLVPPASNTPNTTLTIIMGDVAYELTEDQMKLVIKAMETQHGGTHALRKKFETQHDAFPMFAKESSYRNPPQSTSVVFEVSVGTFLPTPSRDALQFHSKDYDTLANYITEFFVDIPQALRTYVATASSVHDMYANWLVLGGRALRSLAVKLDDNMLTFDNRIHVNVHEGTMVTSSKDKLYDVVVPPNIDVFRRKLGYVPNDTSARRVTTMDITAPVTILLDDAGPTYHPWTRNEIFVWDLPDVSDIAIDRFMRSYFSAVCFTRTRSGRKAKYGGRDGELIVARPNVGTTPKEAKESVSTWLSNFPKDRIHLVSEAYAHPNLSGELRRQVKAVGGVRPPKKNTVLRYNSMSQRFVRLIDSVSKHYTNSIPMVYVIGNPETLAITDVDWASRITPQGIYTLLSNLRNTINVYDTYLLVDHPNDIPDNYKAISLTAYCEEVFAKLATTAVSALPNSTLSFDHVSSPVRMLAETLVHYPPAFITPANMLTLQKWVTRNTGIDTSAFAYSYYEQLMDARAHQGIWNQLTQLQAAGVPLTTSTVPDPLLMEAVDLWTALHDVLVNKHPMLGQALNAMSSEFKYNPKLKLFHTEGLYKNIFTYMEATM